MLHVVSGVAILSPTEVLMAKRSPELKRPRLWEFPGGKVEPGESDQEALVREWSEELGLNVKAGDKIAEASFQLEIDFTIALYVVHPRHGSWADYSCGAMLRPSCHTEISWVVLQEAVERMPCSPAFYAHYPFLRRYLSQE